MDAINEIIPDDELSRSLRGRDFITLKDFTRAELVRFMDVAAALKKAQQEGRRHHILAGQTLAMIFTKASTRTRVSFEVGMWQLGGLGLFLSSNDIQLRRGETIQDTARVLSRYVDGIMIRTYAHRDVLDLAEAADIPVINGLTDDYHPCQVLSDFFTIREKLGGFSDCKLAYIGDGNNVASSLLLGAALFGVSIVVATPPGYEPGEDKTEAAGRLASTRIEVTNDPVKAADSADVIYTDVWVSMGEEEERDERLRAFRGYQVNRDLLKVASDDVIVMHCLPAHRGQEITDEVMDGSHSAVFDEAENRLHVQKAIMALLMRKEM